MLHDTTLYLASASPRRHEILKQLQIPHCVLRIPAAAGDDEPRLPGETPQDYVRRTSLDKAVRAKEWLENRPEQQIQPLISAVYPPRASCASEDIDTPGSGSDTTEKRYILSADTTVVLDGKILGKPKNLDDAFQTLTSLSGNIHHVHTAITLACDTQVWEALSISTVYFKDLSTVEIQAYCDTGDPMGKAGAYGIQGPAAAFISQMSGSYTGVMGLPAYETAKLLAAAGCHWP